MNFRAFDKCGDMSRVFRREVLEGERYNCINAYSLSGSSVYTYMNLSSSSVILQIVRY